MKCSVVRLTQTLIVGRCLSKVEIKRSENLGPANQAILQSQIYAAMNDHHKSRTPLFLCKVVAKLGYLITRRRVSHALAMHRLQSIMHTNLHDNLWIKSAPGQTHRRLDDLHIHFPA